MIPSRSPSKEKDKACKSASPWVADIPVRFFGVRERCGAHTAPLHPVLLEPFKTLGLNTNQNRPVR
jgi:hypothetical protein